MSDIVLTDVGKTRFALARGILIIMAGAAIMTVSAKIQIPFWPVPMTLHTLAVMGFAVAFGPRLAVSIFLTYLVAGAVGLPVFSGSPERGIGMAYMVGPTGGYLAGYHGASWLVASLAFKRGVVGCIGAMLAGLGLIYGAGIAWLALFVPGAQLVNLGIMPFLVGDLLKIALVAIGVSVIPAWLACFRSTR